MRSARRIDELTRNAHLVPGFAYAAFKHVTYPELATDLLYVHGPAFVDEARIARDDEQAGKAGKRRNDVLHDPIRKVLLLMVAAQILEGQNRNGRLIGKGRILSRLFHRDRSRFPTFMDAPDKPNSLPDNGADEPLVFSIVADRGSDRIDAVAEGGFWNNEAGPDRS